MGVCRCEQVSANMAADTLVTIAVEKRDKPKFDKLKVHKREPNHEVFTDLVQFYYEHDGPRLRREILA